MSRKEEELASPFMVIVLGVTMLVSLAASVGFWPVFAVVALLVTYAAVRSTRRRSIEPEPETRELPAAPVKRRDPGAPSVRRIAGRRRR